MPSLTLKSEIYVQLEQSTHLHLSDLAQRDEINDSIEFSQPCPVVAAAAHRTAVISAVLSLYNTSHRQKLHVSKNFITRRCPALLGSSFSG
jgi:hypothetical protein